MKIKNFLSKAIRKKIAILIVPAMLTSLGLMGTYTQVKAAAVSQQTSTNSSLSSVRKDNCNSEIIQYTLQDQQVQQYNTIRIEGNDRYETSAKICKEGWKGESEYAVLVSGENFPDALCAAPLAYKYNAPILLTNKDSLNSYAKEQLIRLNTKNVLIVGGKGVISNEVENELNLMGLKTTRFYGKDRYETSVKVANEVGNNGSIVVSSGDNFPGTISIAPVAAMNKMPIILMPKDYMPDSVKEYLNENAISKTYMLNGGSFIIDDSIVSLFKNVDKIDCSNRNQTISDIVSKFESNFDNNNIIIANGDSFPDALSGSALASKMKSIIILTDTDYSNFGYIKEMIKNKNCNIYLLGGSGSINKNLDLVLKGDVKETDIACIEGLNVNVYLDDPYKLPDTLNEKLYDNEVVPINVTWETDKVSTNTVGTYNYKGKIEDYDKDVILVLNVTILQDSDDITSKFTDENFKNAIYSLIGKKSPEPILYSDVKNITSLDLGHKNISSLSGIEYFTKLTHLACDSNRLTTLDLSKNTALTYLYCCFNPITTLDLSKNAVLTKLYCSDDKLTSLDVSKNTALTALMCDDNYLTSLDVSKNTALTDLFCDANPITSLDVSKNTALTFLHCQGNYLTSLDVSNNTALIALLCDYNYLTTLDVSKNTALTNLECYNNELKTLYSIKNTWPFLYIQPQYTDSTHTTETYNLVITIKK